MRATSPEGRELHRARQERTNLLTWVVGGALMLGGLVVLFISENDRLEGAVPVVLANVGTTAMIAGLINVVWETKGRRSLASEVASMIELRDQVRNAGLTGFSMHYMSLDWSTLLHEAKRIDLVVARANSWRNANIEAIRKVASRRGAVINVYLPDPDDTTLISHLATRFEESEGSVKQRIQEAVTEWSEIAKQAKGKVTLHHHSREPVTTIYRIDEQVVISLFRYAKGRRRVPVFVVSKPGELYDFAIEEIVAVQQTARTRTEP